MKKPITVLLADDHDIVLQGLHSVLKHPGFSVAESVRDGRSLLKAVKEHRPDIVITDITMPNLNGIDAARAIRKVDPKVKIVFLTMHSDIGYATEALALGEAAYVLKGSAAIELVDAIHALMRGETYISPRIGASVLENLQREKLVTSSSALTAREREVLQLIAEGKTFKEIAAVLGISPRTVEFHRNRITAKTGWHTMADLTRYAVRLDIIPETHQAGA